MVKELHSALRSAKVPEVDSIEAVDAMMKAMEGAKTDRQVTKWAAITSLAFIVAIAIKVFTS